MKTIKTDNITIQYIPFGSRYSCHIVEYDFYFSSKTSNENEIIKKAKFMVESYKIFENSCN